MMEVSGYPQTGKNLRNRFRKRLRKVVLLNLVVSAGDRAVHISGSQPEQIVIKFCIFMKSK